MERVPTSPPQPQEPENPESIELTEELTAEEKRLMIDAWSVGVTGTSAPENPETFSNEEIKRWFEESLSEGIEGFNNDVGINPNEALLDAMHDAATPEERAIIEQQYIDDIQQQMNAVKNRVQAARGKRDTHWDSWPTIMREHQTWNCVGGTLIADHLLDNTEIEHYTGWAASHILNILKLSNGDWWYADFTNNSCFKIEPAMGTVEGIQTLHIEDKRSDYELIGLGTKGASTPAILGNLYGMRAEAADSTTESLNDPGKEVAIAEMDKFGDFFSSAPFGNVRKTLYPEFCNFQESEIFQLEHDRKERCEREQKKQEKLLNRFIEPIAEITAKLSSEEITTLMEIARTHTQDIEALLLAAPNEARSELAHLNLPEELARIIAIRVDQLDDLRQSGDEETYNFLLRHTIKKWHNI